MTANPPATNFWNAISKTTQAFILALIIISAYVVFFAWVMVTAPKVNGVFNYDGMKDITATFGIIAAAVVGYYFGQKNLEEATKTAEIANNNLKQAEKQTDNEKKDHIDNMEKGISVYTDIEKFIDKAAKNKDKPVKDISIGPDINVEKIDEKVKDRLKMVSSKLETKKQEIRR